MHRPIYYILGILLTIPYAGYTAAPTPKTKNVPIAQKLPLQTIPQKSEFNTNLIKVRRINNQNIYELNTVDKTAGNDSLASDLLNIEHNNIIFNPVENATIPTDKPKRKLIKVRR